MIQGLCFDFRELFLGFFSFKRGNSNFDVILCLSLRVKIIIKGKI